MCDSKHTLGGPINYRTLYLSSKDAQLKHTLIHKCTTFSASRLVHRFFSFCTVWLYTLSQCNAEKNQLGLHNIIHCWSYALGFCWKLKLVSKQGLGHSNPYHTLTHFGRTPCLSTLLGSVPYPIILLRYTLAYYSVQLYPALTHCCGILYFNTLLGYTQS